MPVLLPPVVRADSFTLSTADTPPYSSATNTGLYDRVFAENVTSYASLTRVQNVDRLFGLLVSGRVDVVLYELYGGEYHVAARNLSGVHALSPVLAERPMYLYLHRDSASFLAPLTEVLTDMRTDGTTARFERSTLVFPRGDG